MNGSNLLWVLDAQTLKVIKKVQLKHCGRLGRVWLKRLCVFDKLRPRRLCNPYRPTNYECRVRFDVGAYPYDMVAANGKIYVAMSGDFEQTMPTARKW